MFNRRLSISHLLVTVFICCSVIFSCNEEVAVVTFDEASIETSEAATIAINYPKVNQETGIAKNINKTVESYIANQIYMGEELPKELTIEEAISQFNEEFTTFKDDFPEAPQMWEVLIDGEVTYKSEELICIAITAYQDTGGAHGNTYIKFLNFDGQTGQLLKRNAIINDLTAFSKVVEEYLSKEVKTTVNDETDDNFFFGEAFKLPESIGFTDEGVVILYNTYEIAAYAQGITEFAIPYEEVSDYLAFNF